MVSFFEFYQTHYELYVKGRKQHQDMGLTHERIESECMVDYHYIVQCTLSTVYTVDCRLNILQGIVSKPVFCDVITPLPMDLSL